MERGKGQGMSRAERCVDYAYNRMSGRLVLLGRPGLKPLSGFRRGFERSAYQIPGYAPKHISLSGQGILDALTGFEFSFIDEGSRMRLEIRNPPHRNRLIEAAKELRGVLGKGGKGGKYRGPIQEVLLDEHLDEGWVSLVLNFGQCTGRRNYRRVAEAAYFTGFVPAFEASIRYREEVGAIQGYFEPPIPWVDSAYLPVRDEIVPQVPRVWSSLTSGDRSTWRVF